jgi:nitrile hydratase subunit beta
VSRAHDIGGRRGYGHVEPDERDAVFYDVWESRVFALNRALNAAEVYNPDEFRQAREHIEPNRYYQLSYYERWLVAMEALLVGKGVLGRGQIDAAERDVIARKSHG